MEKVTIPKLMRMKKEGEKIVMVTAYDYPTAVLADQAGVDVILVGDSVGMVMLGYPSTLPVTMDEVLHHAKAVVRGVKRALVIGDMPFMSYNASVEEAIRNAGTFLKAGCDAVKLEGGSEMEKTVKAIVDAGIPVMGHIGLTPQRFALLGGYKVQGRDAASAKKVIEDAEALEKAGAFAVLLELTTSEVAKIITEELTIPTIGIGSGAYCDGQVLVITDLLGLTMWTPTPKFAKQYVNLSEVISNALKAYVNDVRTGRFPTDEHSYYMVQGEFEKLKSLRQA
ncbi:MAG: 3-methyl-2-oxobutanoate hydroxymethyltransferase [Candidatus Nezhaarchaeales archaeon]